MARPGVESEEPLSARQRWQRRLTWPIFALLLLELLYIVGGNLFLRTEWGRAQANRRADKFTARWESGWTWLPGLLHVEGLEIGGTSRRATWSARTERGRLWVWLPSLVNRHLRLMSVRATEFAVDVQTLPPNDKPRPERRRRGWKFTLARLDLEPLEDLRINEYAVRGTGAIEGTATFQVRGPMEFDFRRFEFTDAVFLSGGEVAAEALEVSARMQIDPVTIGDTSVEEILSGMTGEVRIDSERAGIGFLERYLQEHPWLRLGGRGVLHVELEMSNGWLAPGSELSLDGPVVAAEFLGLVASGEGQVVGGVPEDGGYAVLAVNLDRFSVVREGESLRMAEGEDLRMSLRNDSTAIDRPAEGLAFEVILPPTSVPALEAFTPYLPTSTGLAFTDGEAEIAAELSYDSTTDRGEGWLTLTGERVGATFGDLQLASELALDARFGEVGLRRGFADLSGSTLRIDGVRVSSAKGVLNEGWWGRLALPAAHLQQAVDSQGGDDGVSARNPAPRGGAEGDRRSGPSRIEGLLEAELRDTGPLVALLEERMPKLAWIDGLLTVENVDATTQLRMEGRSLGLRALEMVGGAHGRLEVLGELDLEDRLPEGVLFARWAKLSAALALEEGERDWKLTGSRRWYEEAAGAYRDAHPLRVDDRGRPEEAALAPQTPPGAE